MLLTNFLVSFILKKKKRKLKFFKFFNFFFLVPTGARRISFQLTAKVKQISTGTTINLNQSKDFALNGIDASSAIEDFHLKFLKDGYQLLCLGKTGEPKPHKVATITIKSRWQT